MSQTNAKDSEKQEIFGATGLIRRGVLEEHESGMRAEVKYSGSPFAVRSTRSIYRFSLPVMNPSRGELARHRFSASLTPVEAMEANGNQCRLGGAARAGSISAMGLPAQGPQRRSSWLGIDTCSIPRLRRNDAAIGTEREMRATYYRSMITAGTW
jgi:hypothetical protein